MNLLKAYDLINNDRFQAAEGTGLAFIVFTQAIVELPGAPFWSCIFFLMLLALGLGSQIGILEGMLCVIFDIDLFKRIKKQYMTGEGNCLSSVSSSTGIVRKINIQNYLL